MKFNLKINEIKAALLICSKDESRFVLCGINVELAPDRTPMIISTDGRRLIVIDSRADQEEASDKKQSVILNREALEKLFKLCGRSFNFISFDVNVAEKSLQAHINGGFESVLFKKDGVIDGTYPAWRQTIPNETKPPIGEIGFNPVWLADFGRASKLLGADSEALKVRMHDERGALLIRSEAVHNFIGVLMPCLIEIKEWMPLWIGLDEKSKKPKSAAKEPTKEQEPVTA